VSNAEYWQGSDDGQPREFHLRELRACGFEHVSVNWQYLGEAVIGAQRPAADRGGGHMSDVR